MENYLDEREVIEWLMKFISKTGVLLAGRIKMCLKLILG